MSTILSQEVIQNGAQNFEDIESKHTESLSTRMGCFEDANDKERPRTRIDSHKKIGEMKEGEERSRGRGDLNSKQLACRGQQGGEFWHIKMFSRALHMDEVLNLLESSMAAKHRAKLKLPRRFPQISWRLIMYLFVKSSGFCDIRFLIVVYT